MAMVVQHNIAAQLALGELNKNNSKLQKSLEKVSSGQKIVGAKDDSASFSISELMRVKIRALSQADQNVQNGGSLLRSAEAGIQQQIELVRTIREKVIDADNDTNTDEDRLIIQKEINQLYKQIDQTAYETDYNSKKVLLGDTYKTTLSRYVRAGDAVIDEKSNMYVIPDNYETLDGVTGPFDTFTEYGSYSETSFLLTAVSEEHSVNLTGGSAGTAKEMTIDLSSYSLAALKGQNTGFRVTAINSSDGISTRDFVLTTDTSQNFDTSNSYLTKVNINSCTSVADVATTLANSINSYFGSSYVTASASGSVITLVSANSTANSNSMNVTAVSAAAKDVPNSTTTYTAGSSTGKINSSNGKMSGGANSSGIKGSDDPDMKYVEPKTASLGPIDLSGISTPSGITIHGFYTQYLEFQSGSAGLAYDSARGVYTVGINANVTNQQVDSTRMNLTLSGGKLSFTATYEGAAANSYSISDGYQIATTKPTGGSTHYSAVTGSTATVATTVDGSDKPGTDAYWDIYLGGYSADDVEQFIEDLAGKTLRYSYTSISSYEFIDSKDPKSMDAISASGNVKLDLDLIRQDVAAGKSIAESFGTRFKAIYGSKATLLDDSETEVTDTSDTSILRITSMRKGTRGNNDTLSMWSTQFRHYDIDYGQWFSENAGANIPMDLDGKGFRFYCSTDANQWFNIIFSTTESAERPTSGTEDLDIKTIEINVSQVTDAASLVEAIYDQAMPILTGDDPNYNHHHRMAIDTENGILTIYDRRNWNVNIEGYDYQEKGAKIADGVVDNVVRVRKNLFVRDLIIQDTDKASMNIRVRIPDMRLDSIFGVMPDYGKDSVMDYSLASKEDRMSLLGKPPEVGILDTGLDYLLDAVVLVGAQNARLEHTQNNLVVQVENTTASESTIRDADMAKEMTEYTKNNILQQSAQAMLAQANQNGSAVLSLLQ